MDAVNFKGIKSVVCDGRTIKKIMFNGVRIWEQIETPVYTQRYQTSGYWASKQVLVSSGYWVNYGYAVSSGYWATKTEYVTVTKTCVGSRQVAQYGWVFTSGYCGPYCFWGWGITGYTTENYNYDCSTTEAVTKSYWVDTTRVVYEQRWTDTSYYKTETYWVDTSGWVTDTTINTTYYP